MTPDVNTIEQNMPTTVAAYVTKNPDESFTIVLNSRMSRERRIEAYRHEMWHIQNGDYDSRNADLIEIYAHGLK